MQGKESLGAYGAAKALFVPLSSKSFHDRLSDRLPALLASATVAVLVTSDTPSEPILLYKLGFGIERLGNLSQFQDSPSRDGKTGR